MTLLNDYAPLLLRICLVVLFPFSALDKIVNWSAAMKQAGRAPLAPRHAGRGDRRGGRVRPSASCSGWHDRLAAFVLAGFCAVTAVLYPPVLALPRTSGASRKARACSTSGTS